MFVEFYLWFATGLHLTNKNSIRVKFQREGWDFVAVGFCPSPENMGLRIDVGDQITYEIHII